MKHMKKAAAVFLTLAVLLCGTQSVFAAPVYSELAEVADTVYSVTASPQTVRIGNTVSLTIVTGRTTTQVQVLDQKGNTVAQAADGATDRSGRLYWTVTLPVNEIGTNTFTVLAGNQYAQTAHSDVTVTALSSVPEPVISSVTVLNTTLYCEIENYPEISAVRLQVSPVNGAVLYTDYKAEKLGAGYYSVVAYVRDDAYNTCSAPYTVYISEEEASAYTLLKNARTVIVANEGSYTTVVASDNGSALSIGCLCWYAARAHDLVTSMQKLDPDTVAARLAGSALLAELSQANSVWAARTLNEAEVSVMTSLLSTDISKSVQDVTAENDISKYIQSGRNKNITSEGALIYYADLYNQSPARAIKIVNSIVGDGKEVTLDHLHQYALEEEVMGKYVSRRNRTYQSIQKLGYL